MGKQLVVSGNRILSYGEDCFLSMGGTVICPETSKVFQNATVVDCGYFPSDIDTVGYEYHAGVFVPCAPYGVGGGNVAVVCNEDCKSLKDSGWNLGNFSKRTVLTYTGSGTWGSSNPNAYIFEKVPDFIHIYAAQSVGNSASDTQGILSQLFFAPMKECAKYSTACYMAGVGFGQVDSLSSYECKSYGVFIRTSHYINNQPSENYEVKWYAGTVEAQCNVSGQKYCLNAFWY